MRVSSVSSAQYKPSVKFNGNVKLNDDLTASEQLLLELEYMKKNKMHFNDDGRYWDAPPGNYTQCLVLAGEIEKDDPRLPRIKELLEEYGPDNEIATDILENLCVPGERIEFENPDGLEARFFKWLMS